METYTVRWTHLAELDLASIIEYIQHDRPEIAKEIFVEIRETCADLAYFPQRKRVVPELQHIGIIKYREVLYKRWRIVFSLHASTVDVLLVADSRQNLEDILLRRLLKETP